MTADDTTPARVAAAAEALLDEWETFVPDIGLQPPHRWYVDQLRAALDAQPGDAEQAGGQSAAALESEHLRNHLTDGVFHDRCQFCLNRRTQGGTGVPARASGGPDDGTAERALARLLPLAHELEAACDANVPMTNRREREAARALIREVRAAADTGHQGGES